MATASVFGQLIGGLIPTLANLLIVLYFSTRFLRAMRLHYKMMSEVEDFNSTVTRARSNLGYVQDQISNGMDRIKDDIKRELNVTDRLTRLTSEVSIVLRRFAAIEENVIELVRTDRNKETVKLETPADIREEIQRLIAEQEQQLEQNDNNDCSNNNNNKGEKPPVAGQPETLGKRTLQPEVQLLEGSRPKGRGQNRK